MQILFKYSFLLTVNTAWLEKKSYPLNKDEFLILLLLLSHGKSSLCYFPHFPNSLSLPSVSVYSVKWLTPLLFPFLSQTTLEFSSPPEAEQKKIQLCYNEFFASCALGSELNLVHDLLSFGFVTKTGLDNTGMFHLLLTWASTARTFLVLMLLCQRGGWGCAKDWEGDRARPKGYSSPYDIRLGNKIWGKNKEREMFGVRAFVFPCNLFVLKPCFPGNS